MLCLFLVFLFCHHISVIELYCTDTVTYIKQREANNAVRWIWNVFTSVFLSLTAALLFTPFCEF